ncbi:MAG: electron transport complex protein RnfG [Idiomarinaceae bacterium HL-53]|nr:MAG: electron transport complex protein RnfG [Idiomarinaceae bacterium HL-53]CUS48606.1 electron transport complex protein RnfG [Idiomarinaceae bacterium HL-53]
MIITQMRKNGLILGAFALIATALLVLTQYLTADRIAAQQRSELLKTLNVLIPPALHDNDLFHDCTLYELPEVLGTSTPQPVYRSRLNGEDTALAIQTNAPDGYSGEIRMLVAINTEGRVLGARVLQHKETPGLGDKIETRKSDWILKFAQEVIPPQESSRWEVRKDGGAFEQFTGATITPRAVINAIERTIIWANNNKTEIFAAPSTCQINEGGDH